MKKYKIAVLDDYQNVALESVDWSVLRDRADIAVFQNHLADPEAVIERLLPFDVVCVMRERTPLPRNVIERLPNLKLIASTGSVNTSIDVAAAGDHGIAVVHTGYRSDPTIELTSALILASARHIVTENKSVRSGGWQQTVGTDLRGKTMGVLGLGRIGSQVARIGSGFEMNLIAWSQNMTPEAAKRRPLYNIASHKPDMLVEHHFSIENEPRKPNLRSNQTYADPFAWRAIARSGTGLNKYSRPDRVSRP